MLHRLLQRTQSLILGHKQNYPVSFWLWKHVCLWGYNESITLLLNKSVWFSENVECYKPVALFTKTSFLLPPSPHAIFLFYFFLDNFLWSDSKWLSLLLQPWIVRNRLPTLHHSVSLCIKASGPLSILHAKENSYLISFVLNYIITWA